MPVFKLCGHLTVSCWTEVEAETLEEAMKIAEFRHVANLPYGPFSTSVNTSWHYGSDGIPFDIRNESDE